MNYTKRQFSKEEFLQLPIYPYTRDVPVGTDFLLGEEVEMEPDESDDTHDNSNKKIVGRMASQKVALLSLLEKVTSETKEELRKSYSRVIKLTYWRKLKDGYVSERGGHITMKSIIDVMRPDVLAEDKAPSVDLKNLIPIEDVKFNVATAT